MINDFPELFKYPDNTDYYIDSNVLVNQKSGDSFILSKGEITSFHRNNISWSKTGAWMQQNADAHFYRLQDFPECLLHEKPFQRYYLAEYIGDEERLEKLPEGQKPVQWDPWYRTHATTSVWVEENVVFTVRLPKTQDDLVNGTYVLRHRIMDGEVDFYLKSYLRWEKLVKEAEASGNPDAFYREKWKLVGDYLDMEQDPIRPVKLNFLLDEIPKEVLEAPVVKRQVAAYQKEMRKVEERRKKQKDKR